MKTEEEIRERMVAFYMNANKFYNRYMDESDPARASDLWYRAYQYMECAVALAWVIDAEVPQMGRHPAAPTYLTKSV